MSYSNLASLLDDVTSRFTSLMAQIQAEGRKTPSQFIIGNEKLLRAQGIGVLVDVEVIDVVGHDGAVCGLRTAAGAVLPTDLVVASAGVVPRTELACAAGLPVEHGIVVGADLRSPEDPAVAAIGAAAVPTWMRK